jgi:hypothetical protein
MKPLKIRGFAQLDVSSWPRKDNSKIPQNFTQFGLKYICYAKLFHCVL